MLSIQLFGNFSIKDENGRALVGATPRMQSLLAYLLLNQGSPQSRQQIAALLWPETSEAQARTNLRNLLHRLKSVFPELKTYIQEENNTLQWRPGSNARLDVSEFRVAVVESKTPAGDPQAAMERAACLYTGDLMPSCYDDWILPQREELHQAYLDVLERLVVLLEEKGAYRLAIDYAQRSLRHDPLNEVSYRHLIRLHSLSGDRIGGLRVYHTCAAVLEQELGVEPSAATREAYQLLLEDSGRPAPSIEPAAVPASPKNTLPYPLTSFIGRENEIEEVLQLLNSTRLLTLTGAPGAGKTRLGLEAAARLREVPSRRPERPPANVQWVDLTASTNLASMTQAVAAALGVRENSEESLFQTLTGWIDERNLLLVLDNAEHLMDALEDFASRLLRACPNLRMLITSREALSIAGEVAWTVPPMSYPMPEVEPGLESLMRYEAVRLFVERASAAMPTFRLTARNAASVALICARLEGIPLAIELAAARVKMMTVEQIAARMEEALHLLRSGRSGGQDRHQTLEAAIDWSYRLLPDKERTLFRRLAVFSGGFSLEAAEQVTVCCGARTGELDVDVDRIIQPDEVLELLSRLIDRSLVKVMESELVHEARYTLLEMLRQYAAERLQEAGEVEGAQERHAAYCVRLVEEADKNVRGPQQAAWLQRLEAEHDNLRKALCWAVDAGEEETALRLVNSLWQFWDIRGYFREGRDWLRQALSMGTARSALRAKASKGAGGLAWSQGDYIEARERMFASLDIYRELGERRDVAVGLFNLGLVIYSQRDYASAEPILRESLAIFRELGHKQGIANALNSLGVIAAAQGNYSTASKMYEESLVVRRELGDQRGLAISYGNLGVAALRQGNLEEAQQYMDESLRRYGEIGDKRGSATTLNEMGQLAYQQGKPLLAYQQFRQALMLWQEVGSKEGLAATFEGIAMAAGGDDQAEANLLLDASGLLGTADFLRSSIGAPLLPSDEPLVQQAADLLRERLGQEAFSGAYGLGQRLELEQAIATALRMIGA